MDKTKVEIELPGEIYEQHAERLAGLTKEEFNLVLGGGVVLALGVFANVKTPCRFNNVMERLADTAAIITQPLPQCECKWGDESAKKDTDDMPPEMRAMIDSVPPNLARVMEKMFREGAD